MAWVHELEPAELTTLTAIGALAPALAVRRVPVLLQGPHDAAEVTVSWASVARANDLPGTSYGDAQDGQGAVCLRWRLENVELYVL